MSNATHTVLLVMAMSLGCLALPSVRSQPLIHSSPWHQSPVSGTPDDLLLLPGSGFAASDTVVYRQIDSDTALTPPDSLPTESTALSGIAQVVSRHLPGAMTVHLPLAMATNRSYALWARTAAGAWSKAVLINDARPLWFSPAFVYTSQPLAALPRYLKIIGRNLQPAPNTATRVRLSGPQILELHVEPNEPGLDEYIINVALPERLTPGTYHVSVSRDDRNWVALNDQNLEVRNDPAAEAVFNPSDAVYGGCQADDGRDDALCLQRAIAAAAKSGGVVELGKGEWNLINAEASGIPVGEGLSLPLHVSVRGAGKNSTALIREPTWNSKALHPAFTLEGDNTISDLRFRDRQLYSHRTQAAPFLLLGHAPTRGRPTPQAISNVVISGNIFDKVVLAIADAGTPIRQLFVTYNDFGSYHADIRLAGDAKVDGSFRIDDSIIAHNRFFPGSWLDVADRQGAIATELGAGHRVDFSDNLADGSVTDYLNKADDGRGWRAGFFWHLADNQEQVLISGNSLSCTGDKVGDGEAIALDNNGNTFGVNAATAVVAATRNSITISDSLLSKQANRDVAVNTYYIGHWIQIGEGPGIGQVRKIVSIRSTGRSTVLNVKPDWDAMPVVGSTRISIGREFWQVYILGNEIDHRQPLCQKSNRSDPKGGGISLFAQMADSVVAHNRQFDTDGIVIQNQFTAQDSRCRDCYRGTNYINFVDITHNLIDGEYDWNNDCSSSGIMNSLAAGPGSPPLTTDYGLNIAHNEIRHADGWRGGAIAMIPSWYQGPAPHRWPLIDNALIQHNLIADLWSGPARSCGTTSSVKRTGISLGNSALAWRSVLYGNTCARIPQPLYLTGAPQTERLCKSQRMDACECQR